MPSFVSKILIASLLAICCSSCDTGFPARNIRELFVEKNFTWSDSANEPFDRHMDSVFYLHENSNLYVINRWSGSGQLDNHFTYAILCCPKNANGKYELKHGAILNYTTPHIMPEGVSPVHDFGILKSQNFKEIALLDEADNIMLIYDGDLSLYRPVNSIIRNEYWLRFNVKSRNNPEQVLEHIRMLVPFLQSKPDLSDLMIALKPLRFD